MPPSNSPAVPRPRAKQTLILELLRDQIVTGKLAPGARLPPRRELCGQLGASLVTVHFAVEQLEAEGFVQARGTLGTFVVQNPPHLSNYAVVFPSTPDRTDWSRFWTAIANEALRLQKSTHHNCSIWYGIDGHSDNEAYQRLVEEVHNHHLAGIIFATSPFMLRNTPLLQAPGLPRIAAMAPTATMPEVAAVHMAEASFAAKALDYLASCGRRRIAFLALPGQAPLWNYAANAELSPRGMETRPYWTQLVDSGSPQAARNAMHLLMHDKQLERPDGLIIADDNLVEQASSGLIDAGVNVPGQLDVVAHCNFPWPTPAVVPVKRLGYDARQLLRICLDYIDRQRAHQPVSDIPELPAIFEDELSESDRSRS